MHTLPQAPPPPSQPQSVASSRHPTIDAVPPTAFTTSQPLDHDELRAVGPPRYPRPSRLSTPLEVKPAKAAAAPSAWA